MSPSSLLDVTLRVLVAATALRDRIARTAPACSRASRKRVALDIPIAGLHRVPLDCRARGNATAKGLARLETRCTHWGRVSYHIAGTGVSAEAGEVSVVGQRRRRRRRRCLVDVTLRLLGSAA